MYAITGSELLELTEVPDPVPAPDEVLVRVSTAGVNRADVLQRAGLYPPPPGASEILGLEVSGHIEALGSQVAGWTVGEPVCALLSGGGYAEKVAVPASQLLPIPDGVSLRDAAGLPEVACTVMSNVFGAAELQPGELLLIHGGSSGVGTHAIQVAKAFGARVAVTARNPEKLARCAELGADLLIDYSYEDFVAALSPHGGADVILDVVGADYLPRNIDVLAVGGRLVVIGLQGGRKGELDLGKLLGKRGAVLGTTLRARPTYGLGSKAEVVSSTREGTWPMISSGAVKPVIDSVYPLAEAGAAHDRMTSGGSVGKILLEVG
ncbi:putative oxidoreductase [Gordonia hirsuta DSM 44140 = NBRC 16056]|uniref:Putative oxidoreductase n=1 Tax=Gordonia hirsuta DSM 44140 = NBRC 16056 TaxID=1121927 RepID=L7LFJ1_9ACTN|nr:NAD(P)H-quinone oxidoreductase [Gordonia hirsuta]GAC58852.1 putative oxidoreductase [Gordonia hirsuta DSM 44140 = NBRC 16056]